MGVLREIRELPEVIRNLTVAIQAATDAKLEEGPAEERLEALERSRASWEATMEAEGLRADSRYKAAAASESRSRTQARHAERLLDPFAEEGDEVEDGIPPRHAPLGNGEPVQPVQEDLALLTPKQLALRMKFA